VRSEVGRLLTPSWIASHVLIAALLVATINLGFWQLRRLDVRQAHNAVVAARADVNPVPLAAALASLAAGATPDDLRHVRVVLEGTWDSDAEVVLANRSMDGGPGVHVVALLRTNAIHPGVVVNRGFVARARYLDGDRSVWGPAAEPGALAVFEGTLDVFRPGERGHEAEVDRLDHAALVARWGTALAPMWVRATDPTGVGDWPVPAPVADLGEGSHLSYAVQWFVFSVIGMVGYPLVLLRLVRRRSGAAPVPEDDPR